jgi:hypothetical protein
VCYHARRYTEIIPGKQYLAHYITFIAIVLEHLLYAQVIKATVHLAEKGLVAVAINYFVSFAAEFQAYVAARPEGIGTGHRHYQAHKFQPCGLAAAYGAGKQYAFAEVYA